MWKDSGIYSGGAVELTQRYTYNAELIRAVTTFSATVYANIPGTNVVFKNACMAKKKKKKKNEEKLPMNSFISDIVGYSFHFYTSFDEYDVNIQFCNNLDDWVITKMKPKCQNLNFFL